MKPTKPAIEEAKRNPNGIVYALGGDFGDGVVPPNWIIGAWKTDADGNLLEEFIPNPNFKRRLKRSWWQFGRDELYPVEPTGRRQGRDRASISNRTPLPRPA